MFKQIVGEEGSRKSVCVKSNSDVQLASWLYELVRYLPLEQVPSQEPHPLE